MPQNLISITFPPARTAAIDKAMTALEAALSDLVALEPDARRRLTRMGDKSEAFCRKTLAVVAQNPQVVNPSLGLPDAQADLAAYDACAPAACACRSSSSGCRTPRSCWAPTSWPPRWRLTAC